MRIIASILAAGSGHRFGSPKVTAMLGGKPLWRWSFDAFASHPDIDAVGLVVPSELVQTICSQAEAAAFVVGGGNSRAASSVIALEHCTGFDGVLIHDAARPLLSAKVISSVVQAVKSGGAAAPCVPLVDTIFKRRGDRLRALNRSDLVAIQTPQGAPRELLLQAYASGSKATDDLTLLSDVGADINLVEGDPDLFKITYPNDLAVAEGLIMMRPGQEPSTRETMKEIRTGLGYDIHAFMTPRVAGTVLGGVTFDDGPKLDGHSDADVLIHAVVDALLGAASLGDIGEHFPNTDARWKGASSSIFLQHAGKLISEHGWRILNIDATVIAETPRVMKRAVEVRQRISDALALEVSRVSLKATTNECLGAVGRSEGIAAFAVATIQAR